MEITEELMLSMHWHFELLRRLEGDNMYSFKYIKQHLLMLYGLRSVENFRQNIKIFTACEEVHAYLSAACEYENRLRHPCTIISVPKNHQFSLPNFQISNYDAMSVEKFLNAYKFEEIWVCSHATCNEIQQPFCGRLSLTISNSFENQCIEIIKGFYPRDIEKIGKLEPEFQIFRYVRRDWGLCFQNVSSDNKSHSITPKAIREILFSIEKNQASIAMLADFLGLKGATTIGLDFVFHSELQFIDWDSNDDCRLLGKIDELMEKARAKGFELS